MKANIELFYLKCLKYESIHSHFKCVYKYEKPIQKDFRKKKNN